MYFALVSEHRVRLRKMHIAKLALVFPLRFTSGRVVSLAVGVQLFNRIVVTLADLTNDVEISLKKKENTLIQKKIINRSKIKI